LSITSCSEDDPPAAPEPVKYNIVEAFPNLDFASPTDLQDPGDGTNRLFVAEQDGVIRVFDDSPTVNTTEIFLNIRRRVGVLGGNEQGLLSFAFDPQFPTNGHFYVAYTSTEIADTLFSRISRFTVAPPTANSVDPASEEIVLSFVQPGAGHNGGQLVFDSDGYLYFGFGDGNRRLEAQDLSTLLGAVIRIDVSTLPYQVPIDNPFINDPMARDEIYAFGFRHPWRLTIDPVTETMWTGDVGNALYEEIDIVESGKNYGWGCREGFHEFDPCAGTPLSDFADPIWEYARDDGFAIVGGYVYRGAVYSELVGKYLYADYISGQLWALSYDGTSATNHLLIEDTGLVVSSFGLGRNGVLYVCAWNASAPTKIYKITESR